MRKEEKRKKEASPKGQRDPINKIDLSSLKDFAAHNLNCSQGSNRKKTTPKSVTGVTTVTRASQSSSITKRVLRLINESPEPFFPNEVHEILHIKPSTARGTLRRLFIQGKIVQNNEGKYCSKIIHGVIRRQGNGLPSWKVHNLVFGSGAIWLSHKLDDAVEETGDVKVKVVFGLQRRKITCFISCDKGIEKDTCLFAVNRGLDIVKERTGHDLERFDVKTFEIGRDFKKSRVDGNWRCLTRKGLFGAIERIYQKEEDVVRHEFKTPKSMNLMEFESLLKGGASNYNLTQGLFMVVQEVKKLVEAQRFSNEWTLKGASLNKAILEALIKLKDPLAQKSFTKSIATAVSKAMSEELSKLKEPQNHVTIPKNRRQDNNLAAESRFQSFRNWLNKEVSF